MADSDDDALTWDGDDRLQAPAPAPRAVAGAGPAAGGSTGGLALVVLGVLGGVAVLETVFWIRGALNPAITISIGTGSGSAAEVAAYVANLVGRVLAVVAPLVWFGAMLWRVRTPSRRLAWMGVGAVLLVPWPFLLGLA